VVPTVTDYTNELMGALRASIDEAEGRTELRKQQSTREGRFEHLNSNQFEDAGLFHTLKADGGNDLQYFQNNHAGDVRDGVGRTGFDVRPESTRDTTVMGRKAPSPGGPRRARGTDGDKVSGMFHDFDWPKDPAMQTAVTERVWEKEQRESFLRLRGVGQPLGGRPGTTPDIDRGSVKVNEYPLGDGDHAREYRLPDNTKIGQVEWSPTRKGTLVHTAEVHPGMQRMGLSKQFMGSFLAEHPDTYADGYTPGGEQAFQTKGVPLITEDYDSREDPDASGNDVTTDEMRANAARMVRERDAREYGW
jgi:hypothetical protein